jgi:hypothetical protein
VQKNNPRQPVVLPTAFFLSILTMVLVTLLVTALVVNIPGTAWSRIAELQRINNYNPAVSQSPSYLQLSQIASREDWLIYSPISFLLGGIAFGWLVSLLRQIPYIVKSSVLTAVIISVAVLGLSFYGPLIITTVVPSTLSPTEVPKITSTVAKMAVIQTIYWSLFYVGGSLVGLNIRHAAQSRSGTRTKAQSSATAAPSK